MPNQQTETNYDHTVEIIRNALPRMSELKIPITPSNYAVWYEYLTDGNQALRGEMDRLLERPQPITDAEMRDLYERYLEQRSENLQLAKTALGQVLAALISHIEEADGHYGGFSAELQDIAEQLGGGATADDLNRIIDRATSATQSALERGAEIRQQFSDLAAEMQQVRAAVVRSHEEARTDALTGVFNRLAFQEALDELEQTAPGDTHAPCLIMIDVDHFKQVNDTHGHPAGDHVLRCVAQEVRDNLRGRDMVARYGGEEFVVLLRDTPRSGCIAVADNLRAAVERRLIALPEAAAAARGLSVTVSLGGAWLRDGEPVAALIARADRALYRSKRQGRNRVTWEGQSTDN